MARTRSNKSARAVTAGLARAAEEHIFPVRVYYEDTDAGGVVYYANYLRFAERARTEMLRGHGIESSTLMAKEGVAFAVRRCAADYFRPARLDDRLEVRTRVLAVGGASLDLEQRIVREDGTEAVRLDLKLACMARTGAAARIPAVVRSRLAEMRLDDINDSKR